MQMVFVPTMTAPFSGKNIVPHLNFSLMTGMIHCWRAKTLSNNADVQSALTLGESSCDERHDDALISNDEFSQQRCWRGIGIEAGKIQQTQWRGSMHHFPSLGWSNG